MERSCDIKDYLSKNILESLTIEVVEDVEALLSESDPAAYEYYLRAIERFSNRKSKEDFNVAWALIQKSIDFHQNKLDT